MKVDKSLGQMEKEDYDLEDFFEGGDFDNQTLSVFDTNQGLRRSNVQSKRPKYLRDLRK